MSNQCYTLIMSYSVYILGSWISLTMFWFNSVSFSFLWSGPKLNRFQFLFKITNLTESIARKNQTNIFDSFFFFCGSIFSVFILPLPPTLVLILRCRLKLWPQNSFISSRRTQILNFSFVTLFSSTCSENFNRYFKYTPFTWRGLSVLA